MFIHKGKERKNSSSACGSTLQQPSTLTRSFGTVKESCKSRMQQIYISFSHVFLYTGWNTRTYYSDNMIWFYIWVLILKLLICRCSFLIDNIPVRVFNNNAASGVPFPKTQPMRVYASLWNADDWATQGGRVKTDWTKAPFTASYRKFNANANRVGPNSVSTSSENDNKAWSTQGLDAAGRNRIRWVQNKHMVYNYCNDRQRFPNGLPAECMRSKFL